MIYFKSIIIIYKKTLNKADRSKTLKFHLVPVIYVLMKGFDNGMLFKIFFNSYILRKKKEDLLLIKFLWNNFQELKLKQIKRFRTQMRISNYTDKKKSKLSKIFP